VTRPLPICSRRTSSNIGSSTILRGNIFSARPGTALIAIIDAAYGFWRPITAIRNGDIDANSKTERQEGWLPLIDTPMHPEYPCPHCILSAAVGTVLKAELGSAAVRLSGTSPTAVIRRPNRRTGSLHTARCSDCSKAGQR
jgi:hypothetical protein